MAVFALSPVKEPKVATTTSLIELILLFTGDEFSTGAASTALAEQICWAMKPRNISELRTEVFGPIVNAKISDFELMVLEKGYETYERKRVKGLTA